VSWSRVNKMCRHRSRNDAIPGWAIGGRQEELLALFTLESLPGCLTSFGLGNWQTLRVTQSHWHGSPRTSDSSVNGP
jgi:hypothetical protein